MKTHTVVTGLLAGCFGGMLLLVEPVLALDAVKAVSPAGDAESLQVQVPARVAATIRAEVLNARVLELNREQNDDGVLYHAVVAGDAAEYDLIIRGDGLLLEKGLSHRDEEAETPQRSLDNVPENVRATIRRETGAGTLQVVREQPAQYVAEVLQGKEQYRIVVAADGRLLVKEYAGREGDGE